jgi:hypothetical protein
MAAATGQEDLGHTAAAQLVDQVKIAARAITGHPSTINAEHRAKEEQPGPPSRLVCDQKIFIVPALFILYVQHWRVDEPGPRQHQGERGEVIADVATQ